jgi:hypothetical protein
MRLPDFTKFTAFQKLKTMMGAKEFGTFVAKETPWRVTDKEIDLLNHSSIEVNNVNDVQVLNDGTLAFKGVRSLVYIRDISSYGSKKPDLPRFHIADCSTIHEMKKNNKWKRYVMSSTIDGKFEVSLNGKRPFHKEKLDVCKNCLDKIKFNGFSFSEEKHFREIIFGEFSINDFFTQYPRELFKDKPFFDSLTAPANTYAQNHGEIAFNLKYKKHWKCEECYLNLSEPAHRKFLHLHHINSCKYDNDASNLQVLCIGCHANQEGHSHLKHCKDFEDFKRKFK